MCLRLIRGGRRRNTDFMKNNTYKTITDQKKEKTLYLEVFRILAIFCVMYQHTGGRGADAWRYTQSSIVYVPSLLLSIITQTGLALFWMVSGTLLLPVRESWKKVYQRRMPRIAGALLLFSIVRYLYLCIVKSEEGLSFFQSLYTRELFLPYWFLYEYLGILLILPFLRRLVQNLDEREKKVLFILIIGWNLLNQFSKIYLGVGFMIGFSFPDSVCYFVLGYLMGNCPVLRKSDKRGVWLCVVQFLIALCLIVWMTCGQTGRLEQYATGGGTGMLLAISVWYIVRYICERCEGKSVALRDLILRCGRNVFGIYLIEDYLRNATAGIWEGLSPYISAIPACVIWLMVVFVLGVFLTAGMRRLPLLRKIL